MDILFGRADEGSSAPVFIAQPLQQTAVEGSDVTLECAANGYPKPTILWLKDGVALDLTPSFDSRYITITLNINEYNKPEYNVCFYERYILFKISQSRSF